MQKKINPLKSNEIYCMEENNFIKNIHMDANNKYMLYQANGNVSGSNIIFSDDPQITKANYTSKEKYTEKEISDVFYNCGFNLGAMEIVTTSDAIKEFLTPKFREFFNKPQGIYQVPWDLRDEVTKVLNDLLAKLKPQDEKERDELTAIHLKATAGLGSPKHWLPRHLRKSEQTICD